ncbi:MAG TPA: hypothetical protein VEI97_05185, partial [bacterium]|nr:hypothetical protein [bacterium]
QKPWVIEKRKEVAAENSWEARVERIQGLLAGALEGRYPEPSPEDTAKIGAGAARFKTPPVAAAAAATAGQAHGDGHHH